MSDQDTDHRITPSLHPGLVRALESFTEDDASFIGQAETAFSTAFEGLRQLHNASEKGRKNPSWTEAEAVIQTQVMADKVIERATRAFDSAGANLDKTIAAYEAQLSQPVESQAAHAVSAEIRAHVKGLSTGERLQFIQNVIAKGDHVSASAVLGAPAYLSGLEEETATAMTRHYQAKASPEVARRLDLLKATRALIDDHAGKIFKEAEKAVGMHPTRVAQLRAAKSEAERAFILKDA